MLPVRLARPEDFTPREYDRARGFKLLAHAEIEAFLEQRVVDTVNAAHTAWKCDQKPRHCLIALVAYREKGFGGVPASVTNDGKKSRDLLLRDRINEARKEFTTFVSQNNHGIREKNVLKLLLPVGLREHQLPSDWLEQMNSFGDSRAEAAHGSAVKYRPDIKGEWEQVVAILTGLKKVDQELTKLANK